MRRRLMEVGRLKRLPVRKAKSTEPVQSRCDPILDGHVELSDSSSLTQLSATHEAVQWLVSDSTARPVGGIPAGVPLSRLHVSA